VLSIGGGASISQAHDWKTINALSYQVLADLTYDVFFDYTFGAPWDAIVGTNHVLAMTENSFIPPNGLNMPAIMGALNSLWAPQPQATPDPLNFGEVELGTFRDTTVVLKNIGTGVLMLQNVISSNPVFTATPPQLPDSIFAVGDSAQITVRFQPTQIGSNPGTLTFVTSAGDLVVQVNGLAGVEYDPAMPLDFAVSTYPNPFNPELNVKISLTRAQDVDVDVYTVEGTRLASLHQGRLQAGIHRMTWSAQNATSGLYLLKIRGKGWQEVKKVALVR
jgi:hypothetical protein